MALTNIFRRLGSRWSPDSDSADAAEDILLRADNMVPDEAGTLALRRGSSNIYTSLQGTDVHSLHTTELANGTTYRVTGAADRVSINGVDQSTSFDGSGDLVIGDDAYQIFMARGTTKKKFDGTEFINWGINKPEGKLTLEGVPGITVTVAGFDNAESPATSMDEGTRAYVNDYAGAANSASELTPAAGTSRAVIKRLWSSDQDFLEILGAPGSNTDLFDVYVKFEDPYRVDTVTVVFGADNSSTEPFTTDRFEFVFDLKKGVPVNLKDPKAEGIDTYEAAVQGILSPIDPRFLSDVQAPGSVKKTINSVGNEQAPKSTMRPDANVWGKLSVTRGQFKRIGSTPGRGWDTIRGFKVVYQAQAGYVSKITLSDAIIIGGGDKTLTGTFKAVLVGARITDQYIETSPPSAESDPLNLNHQILKITIPAATLNSKDPQVDEYWIYLFGGFLDTYYRFAIVPATPQSGMTIDELTNPDGANFGDADERMRLTSHGHTMFALTGSNDIVLQVDQSELDSLTENQRLPPYQSGPVDNIVAIAGPWNGRMFIMNDDGYIYPSAPRSPSNYNTLYVIDLTKYGDPLWMVRTASGVYAGMEKDVVFIAGTGDEDAEQTEIDLYPQPLNIGNPPVDKCVWVDGNAVIYRSADGMMMLTGQSLQPLPMAGTALSWRGQSRHSMSALNTSTGRFRAAVDDLMLYLLAPEGTNTSDNTIRRYSFAAQQWSRLVYGQVVQFKSIFNDPDGSLIAGDAAGNLWLLDTGTTDNSQAIPVEIWTPLIDGGQPLARKDPFDIQLHGNTGSATGTLTLYKDGAFDSTSSYTFNTITPTVYRIQASDFGAFHRFQARITGSFSTLNLQNLNFSVRLRPQHSVYLDTGYILPEDGDFVWLQEAEVDMIAANDVTLELYLADALSYSVAIPVTA